MTDLPSALRDRLRLDDRGLLPAVVQQHDTGEVLMVGWMDLEALHLTLTTGRATFWSRSRQEIWVKGETSGHRQWVQEVRLDCDGDTVLVRVDQEGPACHTGSPTCFFEVVPNVRAERPDRPSDRPSDQPSDRPSDQPSDRTPRAAGGTGEGGG